MNRSLLVIVAASVALAGNVNAQLPGGLKDKIEKAAKKSLDGADDKQADEKSQSRPSACKDKSRKYPPGLSYSTVLKGVVVLPKDGRFRLDHIQATFLPDECEGGFVVLRTAAGKEIYQLDWRPDRLKKPYTLLNFYKGTDLRSGESGGTGWINLPADGDYVLDFYLPSEHFYTFPFNVAKIGSDDPFGEGDCHVLNGAWRDWGYLYYRDAKPERSLQWKAWLRNEACDQKSVKIRVEIKRDQDGDLVCTSREGTTYTLQPKWTRFEFDMVFPEGKDVPQGTYFKAQDLLKTDGAYTLTMNVDEKVHGVWKFGVEGGKLKYTGRTLRGEADPLTFVEGGRDAWWYVKQKQ